MKLRGMLEVLSTHPMFEYCFSSEELSVQRVLYLLGSINIHVLHSNVALNSSFYKSEHLRTSEERKKTEGISYH